MDKTSTTFHWKYTLVEELNPMTKILAVFVFGISTLIFPKLWLGFGLIGGLFVIAYIAKILKAFAKIMFGFGVPITIMLVFIQGLYSPRNVTIIADLGFARLGAEGVCYAAKIVSTLLVFMGAFYIMNQTTYPGKLVASFIEIGLSAKVGYLILASLNVVPQMQKRMAVIKEAQEARGVETKGGIVARIKVFIPLLGPVILTSLTDAQERGMTLETRGFEVTGIKKTNYVEVTTSSLDYILISFLIIFFIIAVAAAVLIKFNIL